MVMDNVDSSSSELRSQASSGDEEHIVNALNFVADEADTAYRSRHGPAMPAYENVSKQSPNGVARDVNSQSDRPREAGDGTKVSRRPPSTQAALSDLFDRTRKRDAKNDLSQDDMGQHHSAHDAEPDGSLNGDEFITQVELVAASVKQDIPITAGSMQRPARSTAKSDTTGCHERTDLPSDLLLHLRKSREICFFERNLRRKMVKIPKEQARLLNSDTKYYPTVSGAADTPGNIPIRILDAVTSQADRLAANTDATTQAAEQKAELSGVRQARLVSQPFQQDSGSESGSPETVSRSQWPSSPPEARQRLPADTSPIMPSQPLSQTIPRGPTVQTDNFNSHELPHSTSLDGGNAENPEIRQESSDSENSEDDTDSEPSSSLPPMPKEQLTATRKNPIVTSRRPVAKPRPDGSPHLTPSVRHLHHSSKATSVRKIDQKDIQVTRTPYPSKRSVKARSPPQSSTMMVPASFHEAGILLNQVRRNGEPKSHVNQDVMVLDGFEHNSSEDGISELGNSTLRSVDRHKDLPTSKVNTVQKTNKHKRQNSVQERVTGRGSKRQRLSPGDKIGSQYNVENPYQEIDDGRREQRRLFHKHLAQQGGHKTTNAETIQDLSTNQQLLTAGFANGGLTPQSVRDTELKSHKLPAYSHVRQFDQEQGRFQSYGQMEAPNGVAAAITTDKIVPSTLAWDEIFAQYVSTYPDYAGQQKHFIAACQLLIQLDRKSQALHSFLWDDFVFQYFHNYLPYLHEVIETLGTAVPYDEFYTTRIEQPTHLQRVIKPSFLKATNYPEASSAVRDGSLPPVRNPGTQIASSGPISIQPAQLQGNLAISAAGPPSVIDETLSPAHAMSQSSSASVRSWAQHKAGAESPILGTPQVERPQQPAIPVLDLEANMGSDRQDEQARTDSKGHSLEQLPSSRRSTTTSIGPRSKPPAWPSPRANSPTNVGVHSTSAPILRPEQSLPYDNDNTNANSLRSTPRLSLTGAARPSTSKSKRLVSITDLPPRKSIIRSSPVTKKLSSIPIEQKIQRIVEKKLEQNTHAAGEEKQNSSTTGVTASAMPISVSTSTSTKSATHNTVWTQYIADTRALHSEKVNAAQQGHQPFVNVYEWRRR